MSDSPPKKYMRIDEDTIMDVDRIPKYHPKVKVPSVIQVGNCSVLAQQAFSKGCEAAIEAQAKAFMTRLLKYDRSIMGDAFHDADLFVKRKLNERRVLDTWLVTINFPSANGDPYWAPAKPDKRAKSGFRQLADIKTAVWACSSNAPFGRFMWAYEWMPDSHILHVHIGLTWIDSGNYKTILDYFISVFKAYTDAKNIQVSPKGQKFPIKYLEKNPEDYPDDIKGTEYNTKMREKFALEAIYSKHKISEKK